MADIIDLKSINWSQGMFLTPDHFLRQEQYFDSALLWLIRFVSDRAGLIGGGPRVDVAERGASSFDPQVDIADSGDTLKISVGQCRAVTPGGAIVDVDASVRLSRSFLRSELESALELGIYVVCRPHDKEPAPGVADPINPALQVGRRARYTISVDPRADERPWSVLVSRIRRADRGLRFERVPGFIPPCALMSSHSELMHVFRQLNERVTAIADRYSVLHRAIVDFVAIARTRGIGVDQDLETLEFVSRMVVTLEECAYQILDPLQSPKQFFQHTARLVRNAALFLSLSPPTREYFRLLGEIGEDEFVFMLEQETEALMMNRRWNGEEDLRGQSDTIQRALGRIDRLEQALEGRYMDYRVSPTLESINFVFDRTSGDPVLYRAVARPSRPQAHGQELTFVFAQLRLEAREHFRLIVIGDRQARFGHGDKLTIELRINTGEGFRHAPEYRTTEFDVDGQRNFAFDFTSPAGAVTINDVRVTMQSGQQPIRSAILYVRARMFEGQRRPILNPPPAPRPPDVAVRPPLPRPTEPAPPAPDIVKRKSRILND